MKKIDPDTCDVAYTINYIGGKWKGVILYYLFLDTQRFGELQRLVKGITQRMLTLQLRELEDDGFVKRTIYREVPPKVEYSLTEKGRSLEPVLRAMKEWASTQRDV